MQPRSSDLVAAVAGGSGYNVYARTIAVSDIEQPYEQRPQVIFLMGPTASGKTDLAIALRQHLPVAGMSVDSTLVYRGMEIGTATATAAELAVTPPRLRGLREPAGPCSAADFR